MNTERKLVKQWIDAMPDAYTDEYRAIAAVCAAAFLEHAKQEAKAGRMTWKRVEYWRKWIRAFVS